MEPGHTALPVASSSGNNKEHQYRPLHYNAEYNPDILRQISYYYVQSNGEEIPGTRVTWTSKPNRSNGDSKALSHHTQPSDTVSPPSRSSQDKLTHPPIPQFISNSQDNDFNDSGRKIQNPNYWDTTGKGNVDSNHSGTTPLHYGNAYMPIHIALVPSDLFAPFFQQDNATFIDSSDSGDLSDSSDDSIFTVSSSSNESSDFSDASESPVHGSSSRKFSSALLGIHPRYRVPISQYPPRIEEPRSIIEQYQDGYSQPRDNSLRNRLYGNPHPHIHHLQPPTPYYPSPSPLSQPRGPAPYQPRLQPTPTPARPPQLWYHITYKPLYPHFPPPPLWAQLVRRDPPQVVGPQEHHVPTSASSSPPSPLAQPPDTVKYTWHFTPPFSYPHTKNEPTQSAVFAEEDLIMSLAQLETLLGQLDQHYKVTLEKWLRELLVRHLVNKSPDPAVGGRNENMKDGDSVDVRLRQLISQVTKSGLRDKLRHHEGRDKNGNMKDGDNVGDHSISPHEATSEKLGPPNPESRVSSPVPGRPLQDPAPSFHKVNIPAL